MKCFNQWRVKLFSLFLLCTFHSLILAQVSYLEPIGASEIELLAALDRSEGRPSVRKTSSRVWMVQAQGIVATYNLLNQKVIYVRLEQNFVSEKEALQAVHTCEQFLRGRGVNLEGTDPDRPDRLRRGESQQLSCRFVYAKLPGGGYQIKVSINCKTA